MTFPTAEIVGLIYKLLPGFVAAWVFYSLTAHPRKGPFERTVQALIFTVITQAVVIPIHKLSLLIGRRWGELGIWDEDSAFVASVIVAFILGMTFASLANTNFIHRNLPKRISKRTSFPSEWYSAFRSTERFVYLHLKGRRRIYGWPTEWPDHAATGHFVLERPEWILDDNSRIPLVLTERMLIRARDVVMVEFEKPESEWNFDRDQQKQYEKTLVNLNKAAPENPNGKESAASEAEKIEDSDERNRHVVQRATASADGQHDEPEASDFPASAATKTEIKETRHGSEATNSTTAASQSAEAAKSELPAAEHHDGPSPTNFTATATP